MHVSDKYGKAGAAGRERRLLRPAAGTKGGQRRLRRFLEAVRYPSVVAFARDADLDPATVTVQIRKLEQDFGGQLLVRVGTKYRCRSPASARGSWRRRSRTPTVLVTFTGHATSRRSSRR
ncbi:LysR family transcriptional regulator [Streptomyces shenzhenensis]|uniref:helix-turn-helix domain-containing protein n=1 Tax=Streptomyces shenzhenensis TaxID=943815 RepID=UPI0036A0E420